MTNIGRSLTVAALGLALTMSPAFARGGGGFHGGGGFRGGGGLCGRSTMAGAVTGAGVATMAAAATAWAGVPGSATVTSPPTRIHIPITLTPLIEGKGTANG